MGTSIQRTRSNLGRLQAERWFEIMRRVVDESSDPRNSKEDSEQIATRVIREVHFSSGISPPGTSAIVESSPVAVDWTREFEERTGQYD
jgi:hypothetical protein